MIFNIPIVFSLLTIKASTKHIHFKAQPQDAILREGSPLNIDCLATSDVPHAIISISWLYNGTLIQNYTGKPFTQLNNDTLHFTKFPLSWKGYYQCSVLLFTINDNKTPNEIERALSRRALVRTAYLEKRFQLCPRPDIKVNISDDVSLSCVSPRSLPSAAVYWMKDGAKTTGYWNINIRDVVSSTLDITNFIYKNVGDYRCCVYNSLFQGDVGGGHLCCGKSSVSIYVTQNEPYIVVAPQPTVAKQFHSARLDCLILGNPLPTITWAKNGKEITSTPQHQILANHSLVINSVDKMDRGYYTCSGSNNIGSVQSRPAELMCAYIEFDFVVNPQSQTRLSGETLILHCQSPPSVPNDIKILWYKDLKDVVYDKRTTKLSNGSLKIASIKMADAGLYMCLAYNEFVGATRSSKVAKVTVLVFPVLNIDANMSVVIEHPLSIDCNSSGMPFPNTTLWKRNPDSDQKELISNNGKFQVNNAAVTHGGIYICIAENIAGKATQNVHVDILVPPKVLIAPSNVTLIVGESLSLPCVAIGNPAPHLLYWKFTRDLIVKYISENTTDIIINSKGLFVHKSQKEHEGRYECVMVNVVGRVQPSASVRVLVPPTVLNISSNSSALVSDSLTLSCAVYADPAVEMYWNVKNHNITQNTTKYLVIPSQRVKSGGVVSSLQLTIRSLTLLDAGVYFCFCYNRLGHGSVATSVAVFSAPTIELFSVEGRMHEHDTLAINCTARGSPSPDVAMYHNYTLVKPDTHTRKQFSTSHSVKLNDITSAASGLYQCSANNSIGKVNVNRTVHVKLRPEAPHMFPPKVLSCSVIHLSWKHKFDGYSPIQSTLLEITSPTEKAIHHLRPAVSKYNVTSLKAFTEYSFRARVSNEVGDSDFSLLVFAKTFPTAPAPPHNLSFSKITRNSVMLSWRPPPQTNGIIKFFNISALSRVNFSVLINVETQQDEYRHLLIGLNPYTKYRCDVRAATISSDAINWSNASEPVNFITLEWLPGRVSGITVTVINTSKVNITWKDPLEANGVIIRYHVELIYANRTKHFATNIRSIDLSNLMPYSAYTAIVSAETSIGQGDGSVVHFQTWPRPTFPPRNNTTPSDVKVPDRWLSRDYMLVIIGISAFAVISLFAVVTIAIARCMCGPSKNSSSDVFIVETNNNFSNNHNRSLPLKLMDRIDMSNVDFNEDFIFSDQDTSGENIHQLPSTRIIRNTRTPSVTGYSSVEPYQGQRSPMSPLVKLKGPKKKENNAANLQLKSTPVLPTRRDSGHLVFESQEEVRVLPKTVNQSSGAVNPVYVDNQSRSSSVSDESLEELIEAFLTQRKGEEKGRKQGKK